MNNRRAVHLIASFVSLCFMLLLLQSHFRDLFEVSRTYSTFHQRLHQHPEVLFRYNSSALPSQPNRTLVPTHIHQIHLQPSHLSSLSAHLPPNTTCTTLHANWTHSLWTDKNATAFIATHYPSLLPHYTTYRQQIQRANILRYALLHHLGGVYLDLDITCTHPVDNLLHLPFLTPGAYPAGQNNAFILARAGHPFLRDVLNAVPGKDLRWPLPYVENMLSTGCMFLSNRWMEYVRRREAFEDEDRVYMLADEEGNLEPHMLRGVVHTPLFGHGGASSWHGWDAAVVMFMGRYYGWIGVGVLVLVAKVCVFQIWKVGTRQKWGRRGWESVRRDGGVENRLVE